MADNEDHERFNRQFLQLWIIWSGMISSLVIYVVICHLLEDQIPGTVIPEGFPLDMLRNIMIGLSAAELVLIGYLRRRATEGPRSRRKPGTAPRPVIHKQVFITRYSALVIATLAIAETIGVFGLVLFLLGDGYTTLHLFIGVSAAAMIIYRPGTDEFKRFAVHQIFK